MYWQHLCCLQDVAKKKKALESKSVNDKTSKDKPKTRKKTHSKAKSKDKTKAKSNSSKVKKSFNKKGR